MQRGQIEFLKAAISCSTHGPIHMARLETPDPGEYFPARYVCALCMMESEPGPCRPRMTRDDEVQREMTRYCAGIDQWDAMPVVVEGWLRVFEQLQEQRNTLLAALRGLVEEGRCSTYSPSESLLKAAEAAISEAEGR